MVTNISHLAMRFQKSEKQVWELEALIVELHGKDHPASEVL